MLAALLSETTMLPFAAAAPAGPSVVAGEAQIAGLGTDRVTITQASQRAIINWQSFNIAPNEVAHFIQPNVRAIALNRIFDQNPSQIFGSLRANGTVILLNQNGIMFGPTAQVNVGGLIASSLNLSNANFLAGHYLFEGAGVEGAVKNTGALHGAYDGIYLLAPNVENSGLIVSPGGNVVLGAGKTAYLSNRPDGRGFLAEITAPAGQAVNLKDILADGGQVTLAGRVVNQAGLIRADSVRDKNGRIELLASSAVTLADGSRTLARGGEEGPSQGGTVLALADLTSGKASFETGALIDISGSRQGGDAGFAEVSAASVTLGGRFLGQASNGSRGGRFLIDPTVEATAVGPAELAGFEGSGASFVEFKSPLGSDLRVTGQYDLNAGWQLPAGQVGELRFTSGRDLIFENVQLRNTGSGTRWDLFAEAERHVLFNSSFVETGSGGNISVQAKTGSVSLLQSLVDGLGNLFSQGALSVLRTTTGGGDISVKAGQDIVSPSAIVSNDILRFEGANSTGDKLGGVRLEGTGNLQMEAGRDWIGGNVNGIVAGPGFVLSNGRATAKAQRHIGGPEQAASSTGNDAHANITLATGDITIESQTGNIYLGRVQDKGLSDRSGNGFGPMTVDPSNRVTVTAHNGDIYLSPRKPSGTGADGRFIYPASFHAEAKNGDVRIQRDLSFWGSPTGSVKLLAGKNILGKQDQFPEFNEKDYGYIYVGEAGFGGSWVLVHLQDAGRNPVLAPYLKTLTESPTGAEGRPNLVNRGALPNNPDYVFVGEAGRGGMWVIADRTILAGNPVLAPYAGTRTAPPPGASPRPVPVGGAAVFPFTLLSGPPPTLRLLEADPSLFFNAPFVSSRFLANLNTRAAGVADHPAAEVALRAGTAGIAGTGNIQGLRLTFGSVPFKKQVTIEAAQDLREFTATLAAPAGTESVVSAGRTISMRQAAGEQPGSLTFVGAGTGRVRVGGDLDLGASDGINFRFLPSPSSDANKGGLLDVAVGGNIVMDRSRIASHNGATVSIHGLGANALVDAAGNPRIENGEPVALIGTGITGTTGTRITVTVRDAQGQSLTKDVKFEGKAVLLTGAEERLSGPVTIHLSVVEQNGQLLLRNGERVEVLRADGRPVLVNGDLVLVRQDGTALLIDARDVSVMAPSGGTITVGTESSVAIGASKVPLGILALRGGSIDIFSTGTVNVAKSRIATFGSLDSATGQPYRAGNINITSTNGNINAGSGGADEVTTFTFQEQGSPTPFEAEVPGSGIFSFHSSDQARGETLVFPRFDDPEINAIRNEINKLGFFGRDTSALRAKEKQLLAEREPIFTQIFENFIADKRLGNITLFAQQRNIIVPSAGIRGRRISLLAPNGTLDLQGGVIAGLTSFSAGSVQGSVSSSFSGTVSGASSSGSVTGASSAGGGTLGGITGATGSVSAASSSATAAATSNAAKANDAVAETVNDGAAQTADTKAKQVAARNKDEKEGKTTVAQSLKVKRGVVIQVEVKPQSGG